MDLTGSRKFEFGKESSSIRLKNKLWDVNDRPGYIYNGVNFASTWAWEYLNAGIAIVVNNDKDFWYINNPSPGLFGSYNPTGDLTDAFAFKTDNIADRQKLMQFLEEQIKAGFYINLYTIVKDSSADLKVGEWANDSITLGKNIFSVLEGFGATKIRMLQNNGSVPYVLQAHKGAFGVINEAIASTKNDVLDVIGVLKNRLRSGSTITSEIGPVKQWKDLVYNSTDKLEGSDSSWVNVIGIDSSGKETILLKNVAIPGTSLDFDPLLFPRIKLQFTAYDSTERTAMQIANWRVTYEPLPDAAIAPNLQYSFYKDTIQQGDLLKLLYSVQNINEKPMDSLLVKYTVVDKQNKELSSFKRLAPLLADKTIEPNYTLDTRQLSGDQQLTVEINPNQDQKEWSNLNNFLVKPFYVKIDKTNPLLDVTFDGQHILNGDIITPTPLIVGVLRDENPYLRLNDTVSFKVLLKYPGENDVVQIPFDGSTLRFYPSTGSTNKAYFEYKPTLLKDGVYQLIVQAKDISNNISGALDYKVNFEIVSKQAISNFMNYPNPFTTSTRFAYTLTGVEPPAAVRIQIMTVSGTIVREITDRELGPLKIGRHLTEYAWDGTDQFGDRLANGVYLYRVTVQKTNGAAFEPISNNGDKFFENGFGKMVILR